MLLLRAVTFAAASACAACAPPVEGGVLLEPDDDASGAPGERGRFGVRVERRTLTPATAGSVDADVFTPFHADGASACPCPPFLFVQGGAVAVERYRWLGTHLASRGHIVAAPTHPLDLAFFAIDHAERALEGLRAANDDSADPLHGAMDEAPAIVAGHSLGGVVASKTWAQTDPSAVRHVVLLASYPQDGERLGDRAGRALSIVGSRDERSELADVVRGARAFPDADVIVVDGMNHTQWTDDVTDGERDADGTPTEDTDVVRTRALTFIDALSDDLRGVAYYPFDDEDAWPSGTHAP